MLTLPELSYMLVGEKIVDGSLLYAQIWDNIAPLSASVYAMLDYFFGRSQLSYQIVAYLLTCFQVLTFNRMLISAKAFPENTMIPGLIYGTMATVCYDMVTLTPFLLGLTFILLAFKKLFSHIEVRAKYDEDILYIGLYIGLASLCYLPFCLFTLTVLFILTLFTATTTRRYMLTLYGFLLPCLLASAYFYLTNRLEAFIYSYFSPFTLTGRTWHISLKDALRLFVAPLAFWLPALFKTLFEARLTNYQSRLARTVLVWTITAFFFIFIADQNSPAVFMVIIPPIAFYITHYFLMKRKGIAAELSFLLFAGLSISTYFLTLSDSWFNDYFDDEKYLVKQEEYREYDNKKLLVLSSDIDPYFNAQPATPFLNWQLSKPLFTHLNYYDNLTILYTGIKRDWPELIIDPDHIMEKVLAKMPELAKMYTVDANGNYQLREGSEE